MAGTGERQIRFVDKEKRLRANILDPGLTGAGGHHLEYDLRVARELMCRGIKTRVYAHVQASAKVREVLSSSAEVTPLFRASPYAKPIAGDPLSGELAWYMDGVMVLAEELAQVGEAQIWIWPSIFAEQLHACALAAPAATICGCIHADPTFRAANGRTWWRHAFLKARDAKLRLNIGVMVPALEREYSPLTTDGHINRFPVGHDGSPTGKRRTELRRIGFFGHQRLEKGAGLLPALIPRLLSDGYQVVLQDSGSLLHSTSVQGLTVLPYLPFLADEIARCDLIVAPYDPAVYRIRGSGIVWESLASGVPVIVPAGSAPGALVQSSGAGVLFPSLDADAIYRSIREAKDNYDEISTAAFNASLEWPGKHGMKHFVSAMLGGF